MNINQIAINSVSTTQANLPEAIAAYSAAGFKQIELVFPLLKKFLAEGKTIAQARALLAEHGIKCVGGFETHLVVFGSESDCKQNHEVHLANARLLAELGGGVLVVGTDGPARNDVAALDTIGHAFAELAGKFDPSVKLAIEFNWSPIVKSVRGAYRVAAAANHPQVGILFDTAHYHCTSSKLEDLKADVVRKIVAVHVNDMRDKPGELCDCNGDRVLPGEGTLDLKQILGRLEQHGYRGVFSIEMFNADLWNLPANDAAKQCHAAMKKLCA